MPDNPMRSSLVLKIGGALLSHKRTGGQHLEPVVWEFAEWIATLSAGSALVVVVLGGGGAAHGAVTDGLDSADSATRLEALCSTYRARFIRALQAHGVQGLSMTGEQVLNWAADPAASPPQGPVVTTGGWVSTESVIVPSDPLASRVASQLRSRGDVRLVAVTSPPGYLADARDPETLVRVLAGWDEVRAAIDDCVIATPEWDRTGGMAAKLSAWWDAAQHGVDARIISKQAAIGSRAELVDAAAPRVVGTRLLADLRR